MSYKRAERRATAKRVAIPTNDFFDGGPPDVTCSDCGERHEWLRPGKTQPTCDCHLKCRVHGVEYEYRGEDHPANVAARKAKIGMIMGYHCPSCEADWDARVLALAESQ